MRNRSVDLEEKAKLTPEREIQTIVDRKSAAWDRQRNRMRTKHWHHLAAPLRGHKNETRFGCYPGPSP
jgi:hypothetical protein